MVGNNIYKPSTAHIGELIMHMLTIKRCS